MSFKGFFFFFFFSTFSSGNHVVQQSRTILAILAKGHKRNIDVKLFKSGHWPRRRCCLKFVCFFQFLAMAAICSAKQNFFSNFGKGP